MIPLLVAAIVGLTNEFGTVSIDTFGANVLSYVPKGGREVFFRQSEARQTNQWFHGGVPICWPWFGRYGDPGSALHGFAAFREWTVDELSNGKGESRAVLRLERENGFRLVYEVRLDRELSVHLSMLNLGRDKFVVTTGFHPYFSVSHPDNVGVVTSNGTIRCRGGMDESHSSDAVSCRIEDSGWSRRIELKTFGNNRLVVWNIGPEDMQPGFRKGEWTGYICVEPAVIPRCDGFYLHPNETYGIGMSCRVDDAEGPYAFRERLETVHEPNRRDTSFRPASDEFVFTDGMKVDDTDFADYLNVSMGVKATVGRDGAVVSSIDGSLHDREYAIEVRTDGVEIRAADRRALHQAYYHLEDLMNLRCAPFLKIGRERRRLLFSPRMVHSGWGLDIFPDAHLRQMAHHGIDAILIFLKDVDATQGGGEHAGVNDIIERALACGIDTYLYSKVQGFAHPDDPEGAAVLRDSFGRVAASHPKARGIVFVGESCQFPSRDPRVQPVRHEDKDLTDPRPLAGWFPCNDYPDWLAAVKAALHAHAPGMEIVFWTYNWSRQPVEPCADLVGKFPDGVSILSTFGKGEQVRHRNGLVNACRDYTISCPGPTRHFSAEAKAAGEHGRRLYAMANTGGLTWDFGVIPYQPVPYQWKRRWDALRESNAEDGLSGLMESHHYGWHPSFVSELAKEAFTEGGIPFDEHIRKIAARDFGDGNADRVVAVWKRWSEAAADYVATNENQYGPFRIGPAYPFDFGGEPVSYGEFPQDAKATFTMRWMTYLNYPYDRRAADLLNIVYNALPGGERTKEVELLEFARAAYMDGADELRRIAATLDDRRCAAAGRLAGIGEFMGRTVRTAINLRRGYAAHEKGDRTALLEVARDEYANAEAALKLVEADSRLGWEPSMEYAGSTVQIRWKLERMERLYGVAVRAR